MGSRAKRAGTINRNHHEISQKSGCSPFLRNAALRHCEIWLRYRQRSRQRNCSSHSFRPYDLRLVCLRPRANDSRIPKQEVTAQRNQSVELKTRELPGQGARFALRRSSVSRGSSRSGSKNGCTLRNCKISDRSSAARPSQTNASSLSPSPR